MLFNICCQKMKKNKAFLAEIVGLVSCFFVLSASFYFQYVKGLEPCPLCIMQRLSVALMLLLFIALVLVKSLKAQKRLLVFQVLLGAFGLYFACRQLWLQSLPAAELPACLPGLEVMLHYFPWSEILRTLFLGAAECAEITWRWLGISMAGWSAINFAFLLVVTVFARYEMGSSEPERPLGASTHD